jgi:hypothetical protein
MANPALLALLLGLALLALVPARRLHLAGWPGRAVLAYYLVLLGLAVAAIELRAAARFLVPILIVAYLAPFVTVGDGLGRLLGTRGAGRQGRGPAAAKDVTPPTALLEAGDDDAGAEPSQRGGESLGRPEDEGRR